MEFAAVVGRSSGEEILIGRNVRKHSKIFYRSIRKSQERTVLHTIV
jgi:hypothetical protein